MARRTVRFVHALSIFGAIASASSPRADAASGEVRAVGHFVNVKQRLCLEVSPPGGAAGFKPTLTECAASRPQLWGFNAAGQVLNGAWPLCLAPTGAAEGATLRPCLANDAQAWTVRVRAGSAGPGFELVNKRSGLCLDPSGSAGAPDAVVGVRRCDGGLDQLWNLDTSSAANTAAVHALGKEDLASRFLLLTSSDPARSFTASALVAALAAAQSPSVTEGSAPPTTTPDEGRRVAPETLGMKPVQVVNRETGLCVAPGDRDAAGHTLTLVQCDGRADAVLARSSVGPPRLLSAGTAPDKAKTWSCLDVATRAEGSVREPVLRTCVESASQTWSSAGGNTWQNIKQAALGLCLEATPRDLDGALSAHLGLRLAPCSTSARQQFLFVHAPSP